MAEATAPTGTTDEAAASAAAEAETGTKTGTSDDTLGEGGVKALAAERTANREAQKRITALEKSLKVHEDEKLTATQKLEQERDDYKGKYEGLVKDAGTRTSLDALTAEAKTAGAVRPDAVARLADLTTYDPAKGAAPVIADLRKTYPELFRPAGSADTAQHGDASTPNFNSELRKKLWG